MLKERGKLGQCPWAIFVAHQFWKSQIIVFQPTSVIAHEVIGLCRRSPIYSRDDFFSDNRFWIRKYDVIMFFFIRITNVNFKSISLRRSRRNTMPMFEFVNKISFKFITAPTWMKWFYVPVFWFCMYLAIFKNKINHDAILYIKW